MADILIKNMEMPICCGFCRFCKGGTGADAVHCEVMQKYISDHLPPYDSRMDWCPLVALPEHGRLIDADELEASDAISVGEDAWNMVHNAPTVLEANYGSDN